ncbi:MAG TPA: Hsp20/alpha crystallin family protein [Methylomirabilota bacterium]|nr:Hsp20/alpha crystallin family protein [Methylomirabilota bacterium]
MRYRRSSTRYTLVVTSTPRWPFGDLWESAAARLLGHAGWRPDADTYETATTLEVAVDLAGVQDDEVEVQLFEDVLVVEGRRALAAAEPGAVYHAAAIRQGPFQLQVPLPAPIDAERVEARFERGLLRITLPKRAVAR